jgi:uncharacterized oligopeptide transporter (OPT) family protein
MYEYRRPAAIYIVILDERSLTHRDGPFPSTTATAELLHLAPHTFLPTSSSLSQHTPSHSSDTLCLSPATIRTISQLLVSSFREIIKVFVGLKGLQG